MTTSIEIGAIAEALAKAQSQMKNATLNKTVSTDKYKFRFADLPQVRDTVTPALSANGIAVVQTLGDGCVVTRLVHSSGQWIESVCPIPQGQTMQALGSAITYARRYSLSAICCIAAEEDDDGGQVAGVPMKVTHVKAPAGFEDWLIDMEIAAKEGRYGAEYEKATDAYRKAIAPEVHAKLKATSAAARRAQAVGMVPA